MPKAFIQHLNSLHFYLSITHCFCFHCLSTSRVYSAGFITRIARFNFLDRFISASSHVKKNKQSELKF